MSGEPEDKEGECNARLTIGDNWGDNHATMRCQLAPGHTGPHQERYQSGQAGAVTVTWEHDQRETCDNCDTRIHLDDYRCFVDGDDEDDEAEPACLCEACRQQQEGETA